MSLLIDALKKHRLTSAPSMAQAEGDALKSVAPGKAKKIVIISLITVIVITLTATASFLFFKHMEKKRIAQTVQGKMEQMQKIKALIEEKSEGSGPGKALGIDKGSETQQGSAKLREKLMQRIQQRNENQPAEAPASSDAGDAAAVESNATATENASSVSTDNVSSAQPAANNETLRDRLAARRANSTDKATENNQQNSEMTSSADTASMDASSNNDSQDNMNTEVNDNSNDNADNNDSSDNGVKVDIKATPDQQGANNPTYQKALEFMQYNQYDKALALLVNHDDLLLKTQGLSALLLARIYLTTGEYELADHVLDRALLLHVGSEIDMLGLRAQALFMQRKYQETIDLLSSQSPDLSTSPEYYALLADAYMHLDQASNAVSVFQQIVAQFPNSPHYWLGLAVAYQKTGDAGSAIVAYRRAAQLSANDPQVTLFINQQLQALQVL